MSKAVLISIKPKWAEKIVNGYKTIEVRRTRPKIDTPFKCYIYCTYGQENENYMLGKRGKVIGDFVCDKIEKIKPCFEYYSNGYDIDDDTLSKTYLTREQFMEYGKGKSLYGWHISDLKIYDEPKPIMQFYKPCPIEWKNCPGCELYSTYTGCCMNNIDRPPESWCYVEEI